MHTQSEIVLKRIRYSFSQFPEIKRTYFFSSFVVIVQSLSCVRLFQTSWTAARQAYLSITISQSLLKLMSIELVMWSVSFLRSSKTVKMKVSVAQLHLTLCRPVTVAQYAPHPWNSPGKNNTVGCHSLLQGIFLTQGLNLCLLHSKQILYHLSHQGSVAPDQII